MKRVTLLYPHTHAGVPHETGFSLNVPDHVATWLINHGIVDEARVERAITVPPPVAQQLARADDAPAITETPVAAEKAPTKNDPPIATTGDAT